MEAQRWQATLALKNNLRERLTRHVVLQQEMLHHLDALVSSEVSKAPPLEGAAAAGASLPPPLAPPAGGQPLAPPPAEPAPLLPLQPTLSSGSGPEPPAG